MHVWLVVLIGRNDTIYLGPEIFSKSMAYVALSRLRSLNVLVITTLNPNATGFKVNAKICDEIERLQTKNDQINSLQQHTL
jgi:hypothetical protein